MRRIKYKKRWLFKSSRVVFILIILIIINTFFYFAFFINKLSNSIVEVATRELKEITFSLVTKNLTKEKLIDVTAEDLIIVKKNSKDEITDVDFKLDKAYEVMIDIKNNIEKDLVNLKSGIVPSTALAVENNLVIKIPYYAYTKNAIFMNLGPKIYIKINLLENIIGDVYTKMSSYGINTVLINLYLKIYVTESFLYPVNDEKIEFEFEVLIASKIIQGKIPSFYNGVLESNSSLINVK